MTRGENRDLLEEMKVRAIRNWETRDRIGSYLMVVGGLIALGVFLSLVIVGRLTELSIVARGLLISFCVMGILLGILGFVLKWF